jgi:CheY-like chemotaxis protein
MLHLLAVDDSAVVRTRLVSCLEPLGFEVDEAENGAAALRMIRAQHYDLVFLDINMPVLDGPSLLRILHAQGVTVPVVLVTSATERGVAGMAVKLGSNDFLSKPFTPESVKETLCRALRLEIPPPPPPPRLLVLDPNGLVPAQLRALLPPHVKVEEAQDLPGAAALAGAATYDALVVDPDAEDGQPGRAFAALRELQPAAGRFLAGPAPEGGAPGADAVLPVPFEEGPVRALLLESCLRPVAFVHGNEVRLASLRGADPGVFFAVAVRRLLKLASALTDTVVDLKIDLTRAPAEEGVLAPLVLELRERLEELGVDPTFVVTTSGREALGSSNQMARTAFVVS